MKLILLSDIHATSKQPIGRSDNYIMTCMSKLDYVYSFAKNQSAVVLQTGDFVDRTRDWLMVALLMEMMKRHKVKTYVITGQHDMYYRNVEENKIKSTTMGILREAGLINFLHQKVGNGVTLYGAGWKMDVPEKSLYETEDDYRVLLIHSSISMNKESHVSTTGAKKFAKKYKDRFDLIVCGDIHKSFKYTTGDTTILNTGPMLRKEATEYNYSHEPHFYMVNTRTRKIKKHIIPHADAEEVLLREHIERESEIQSIMDDFMEAVESAPEEVKTDVLSTLYELMNQMETKRSVVDAIERIIHDAEQN